MGSSTAILVISNAKHMHNQLHQPMNTSTDIYNEQKEAESKEQEAGVGKK